MSDTVPVKNSTGDLAALERRLDLLEKSVANIVTFDQTVKNALTYVVDRLKAFETFAPWAPHINRLVETSRSVEMLGHASRIFPKTRSAVFVARDYFGDNIKYTFLAFHEYARTRGVATHFLVDNDKQYDLLTSVGLPCMPVSPEKWNNDDVRALLGAKVVVFDDNFHPFSKRSPKAFGMLQGAKSVQLWHGIPIKDVGLRYILRVDNVLLEELISSSGPFDIFVGTARGMKREWRELFAFDDYEALGYPRNDVFFRELQPLDLLNVDLETYARMEVARKNRQPTMLYTPTYRDDQSSNWFAKAGIGAVAEHARARGYVFAVNLHPFEQGSVEEFRKRYPGIHFLAPGTDSYPVVKHADILVTDYSSLAFDFLMVDRPLVFYRPDHQGYTARSRGFIEGRLDMTPGAVCDSPETLIHAIDDAVAYAGNPGIDPHRAARHDLRRRLFDHVDGNAAQRVCEAIMRLIDEP